MSSTSLGTVNQVSVQAWTYYSGNLLVKGRLYLPQGVSGRLPVVIFSHDGISGISEEHNRCSINLAKAGYVVFSPSYRGEDGSQGTIEIAKGEVDDVLNVLPYLASLDCADTDRVVLMGASHGALISLLAAPRCPNLRGLIFAYGVSDIYTWWDHLKATKQLGSDAITKRTYGNGPEDRPTSFALRHGLSAVGHFRAPVLILQGKLDTTTPLQQAQRLHQALNKAQVQNTLRIYPDALHGFLVYAPYLTHDVTAAERQQARQAWQEVYSFLRRATAGD